MIVSQVEEAFLLSRGIWMDRSRYALSCSEHSLATHHPLRRIILH